MHAGPFAEEPEEGMEPLGAPRALADDLRFLQRHLARGGCLRRLDHVLVVYRHHGGQLSHATPAPLLRRVRAQALEARVLSHWPRFSVWGAGRDAKALLACLSPATRSKVVAFAEVNPAKVGSVFDSSALGIRAPVVHWSKVTPPVLVCVARGRTGGQLEANVRAAGLTEGVDCWYAV
jgi:hypothetical protein